MCNITYCRHQNLTPSVKIPQNLALKSSSTPSKLSEVLSSSGPTTVKFGQALSNRADVVSPAYVNELQKLQDNVGGFDANLALETIERDLGASLETLFEVISAEPIASASLGQVYRAKLRGMDTEVAVKVNPRSQNPIPMWLSR